MRVHSTERVNAHPAATVSPADAGLVEAVWRGVRALENQASHSRWAARNPQLSRNPDVERLRRQCRTDLGAAEVLRDFVADSPHGEPR